MSGLRSGGAILSTTIRRTVRRSQTVVPFGPGAIYDFGNESLVALDISQWPVRNCKEIRLPRLEAHLAVTGFKEPPVAEGYGKAEKAFSVPYMRFPTWLFCPNCTRMFKWTWNDEIAGEAPRCRNCSDHGKLAPMRFIAICADGHLLDVPWGAWAHSRKNGKHVCQATEFNLRFVSDPGKGGGLESLSIKCDNCDASRDLGQLCQPNALRSIGKGNCPGRHPWQSHENAEPCTHSPRIVQRGESNAYFADTLSALDITEAARDVGTDELTDKIMTHAYFPTIQQLVKAMPDVLPSHPAIDTFLTQIADSLKTTKERVWQCFQGDSGAAAAAISIHNDGTALEQLKRDEWNAFRKATHELTGRGFVTQRVDLDKFGAVFHGSEEADWKEFRRLIRDVILVRRIRIVKALTGFRRLDANGRKVAPTLSGNLGWLPATEVFGEGIYLELDYESLRLWEENLPSSALAGMAAKQQQSQLGASFPPVTPRGVLLHTLSHLLIRQLSFECGYSSSSLSERIYCSEKMAGILIYTGSADSEGSLGGLVREGEADRIYSIVRTALFRAEWCSNDPICSEMPFQGMAGLNRAACHACVLIGETSCESANALLDRSLLFGGAGRPGYFEKLMKLIGNPA